MSQDHAFMQSNPVQKMLKLQQAACAAQDPKEKLKAQLQLDIALQNLPKEALPEAAQLTLGEKIKGALKGIGKQLVFGLPASLLFSGLLVGGAYAMGGTVASWFGVAGDATNPANLTTVFNKVMSLGGITMALYSVSGAAKGIDDAQKEKVLACLSQHGGAVQTTQSRAPGRSQAQEPGLGENIAHGLAHHAANKTMQQLGM